VIVSELEACHRAYPGSPRPRSSCYDAYTQSQAPASVVFGKARLKGLIGPGSGRGPTPSSRCSGHFNFTGRKYAIQSASRKPRASATFWHSPPPGKRLRKKAFSNSPIRDAQVQRKSSADFRQAGCGYSCGRRLLLPWPRSSRRGPRIQVSTRYPRGPAPSPATLALARREATSASREAGRHPPRDRTRSDHSAEPARSWCAGSWTHSTPSQVTPLFSGGSARPPSSAPCQFMGHSATTEPSHTPPVET